MKKIPFFIVIVCFIASCGGDNGGPATGLTGTVMFNDTTIEMNAGMILDFGASGNFYNRDFYLTDGSITAAALQLSVDGKISIQMELFAVGETFSDGTFNYAPLSETPTSNFFYEIIVTDLDTNKDYTATGGSITLSGSENEYDLTLNLNFEDDMTLTGSVSGLYASRRNNQN